MQASTEPEIVYSPEVDIARRLAFTMSLAEQGLGLAHRGLPLPARLDAILQTGMEAPEKITPLHFEVIFHLKGAGNADQSLAV